jgi:hypothetical protein
MINKLVYHRRCERVIPKRLVYLHAPYLLRCPPNGEMKSLVVNVNLKLIYISYLWTYDLYGSVRNAFHVVKSITRASGRGLCPGNFGPCEMKSQDLPASKALLTGPYQSQVQR